MDVAPADAVLIWQFPSQNIQDIIPHPVSTVDIEKSTLCISPTSGDVIKQFFPLVPFQVIFLSLVFCCLHITHISMSYILIYTICNVLGLLFETVDFCA